MTANPASISDTAAAADRLTVGLLVELTAKEGGEQELEDLLRAARDLAAADTLARPAEHRVVGIPPSMPVLSSRA